MSEAVKFHFVVDGEDFTSAGQASVQIKKSLRQLGIAPEIIRKVSIAMYEGEINMVIHADGGVIDIEITKDKIHMFFKPVKVGGGCCSSQCGVSFVGGGRPCPPPG